MFILAVPLLAERFLSTTPALWSAHYHYSLAIAPVLAMGATAGLANLTRKLPQPRRRTVLVAAAGVMLLTSLASDRFGASDSALSQLTRSSFYTVPAYLAVGLDEYLVVNVLQPSCCGNAGNGTYAVLGQVLDTELRKTTPIFYQAGWLVARRPPSGEAPTNGVLAALPRTAPHQLGQLSHHRRQTLTGGFRRLIHCEQKWVARDRSGATCFAAADDPVTARQAALERGIKSTIPALDAACAELATASLGATHQLTLPLGELAPAAASPARTALPAAADTIQTQQNNLDLVGQLDRFLILCTQRPSAHQP